MSIPATAIGAAIGVVIHSDLELSALEREGLPLDTREGLLRLGLTPAEIAQHVIPSRTWSHRQAQRKSGERSTFSAEESGRVLRMIKILLHATQLFGDQTLAIEWMRTPKARFAGQTPLAMVETEYGAGLVEEMIIGGEDGFCA
jgi:putative toxin-antitoxin system antitoxin component (TIGR02293 family)